MIHCENFIPLRYLVVWILAESFVFIIGNRASQINVLYSARIVCWFDHGTGKHKEWRSAHTVNSASIGTFLKAAPAVDFSSEWQYLALGTSILWGVHRCGETRFLNLDTNQYCGFFQWFTDPINHSHPATTIVAHTGKLPLALMIDNDQPFLVN